MGPVRGFYKCRKDIIGFQVMLCDIDGPITIDFSILLSIDTRLVDLLREVVLL